MNWTEQDIEIRVSKHGTKRMQRAWVSEDGLFAIYQTCRDLPQFGYTITHVASGYSLSQGHSNRRNAELFVAIWRALPVPWGNKTHAGFDHAAKKMPKQLRLWINAVRPN